MRTKDQVSTEVADLIVRYANAVDSQDTLEDTRWSYTLAKGEMNEADAFRALSAVEAAGVRMAEMRATKALQGHPLYQHRA